MENAKVLKVDPRWFELGVKESIHIRAIQPSLNKDGGRYILLASSKPEFSDQVLVLLRNCQAVLSQYS